MEALLSHCGQFFAAGGNIFLAFFLGGVTGGFTHCLMMCGPFVACERACAGTSCGKAKQAGAAMGLSYHLGRFTTYGALGFAAALFSRQLAANSWWHEVSAAMLALAGILFLASCAKSCTHSHAKSTFSLTYLRGVLLGFMPCGLLYAALMMAAATAHPLQGLVGMWLFTLGTLPALLIASGSADLLSRKWQFVMARAGRAMMAFNGLSLLVMAAKLS